MDEGIDGFLGTRASIMLDVVFLAMFVVLPVLGWSIYLVKRRRNYLWHKRIQVGLGLVLLVAVSLFEIDMQFLTNWRLRAEVSPYFEIDPSDGRGSGAVMWVLWIHLVFAVSTAILWTTVIIQALRKFPSPPGPCGSTMSITGICRPSCSSAGLMIGAYSVSVISSLA